MYFQNVKRFGIANADYRENEKKYENENQILKESENENYERLESKIENAIEARMKSRTKT